MEAAAHAEVDPMRGVSENIIMGQVQDLSAATRLAILAILSLRSAATSFPI